VLAALAPKIELCKGQLDAQEVGNAVYGLQNMTVVCARCSTCSQLHAGQQLGTYCLGMDDCVEQVRVMLRTLERAALLKRSGISRGNLAFSVANT
jgi:hypothetical protein